MHPTGLEPATKASEAYVLSIRLRVQIQHEYFSTNIAGLLIKFHLRLPIYEKLMQNTEKYYCLAGSNDEIPDIMCLSS